MVSDLIALTAACSVGVLTGSLFAASLIPNDILGLARVATTNVTTASVAMLVAILAVGAPLFTTAHKRHLSDQRTGTIGLCVGVGLSIVVPSTTALLAGYNFALALLAGGLPILWCTLAAVILTWPLIRRPLLSYSLVAVLALIASAGAVVMAFTRS